MKAKFITITALSVFSFVSCKEKSPEVKNAEEATQQAVESGAITKEQGEAINKQVEKAADMQAEAKKMVDEQLAKLDKATTVEEMRAAVKDATKASVEVSVKAGVMAKEQAELSLKALDSIDMIPEAQLKATVEQLKTQLRAAQNQAK